MIDTLIDILKTKETDGWRISDEKIYGWEFYFIRHALDQNRVKKVEHIHLTVFRKSEDGQFLGSASAAISPTETKENAEKLVEDLIYRAGLVKNRIYSLHEKKDLEALNLPVSTPEEMSESLIHTMNSIQETDSELLNSYEIFSSVKTVRLVTSTGIDYETTAPVSMVEVVSNARKDDHEIELYRMYNAGSFDTDSLKKDCEEVLRYGKDRLSAVPTPVSGKYDVVFSTDVSTSIYDYFLTNLSARAVVMKISPFEIGKVIDDNIEGDKVTLKAVRELPHSSKNAAFDAQGGVIRDVVLMEDSVPRCFHGDEMFGSYLGLEDSFLVSNVIADGGSKTADELRTGNFLEVVEFSDFQVDGTTGDIFGEIRLGYLHDESGVRPVTGGSVSGSMKDFVKKMYFSKEQKQYDNKLIPAVTRLSDVTVTGAE